VSDKCPVDKAQVKLVGVVRVGQNSNDHSAAWNAIALELLHVVSRWGEVACGTERFPHKARKTLPMQPVGTDRTVSVELVEHREIHLYTNVTHVRSQENVMSNGEVLAAVNKIHNQKSRNLNLSQVFPVQNKSLNN
jgi:hypothetical protein